MEMQKGVNIYFSASNKKNVIKKGATFRIDLQDVDISEVKCLKGFNWKQFADGHSDGKGYRRMYLEITGTYLVYEQLTGNTATLPLSNSFSMTIKIDDSGEYLYYQYNYGDVVRKPHHVKIYYNLKGEPFFKCNYVRYYLNEFLRDNL